MKKTLTLFIAILLSVFSSAQSNSGKTLFFSKSLTDETLHKIYARTSGGSIDVIGITSGETRLEVYLHANNTRNNIELSKEEIQARMEQNYDLNISISNKQLEVIAKPKSKNLDWKQSLNISFQLFVNTKISTDLNTSGGAIHLSNLTGDQNFSTSGGSLDLDKLDGSINGKTSGGGIRITNSSDNINLKTSGGGIKAANCKGTMQFNTSGGSLNFENLSGDIQSRTSGGSIRADNISGEFSTHTAGGEIDLRQMSCSIDASTSGGSIDADVVKVDKHIKLTTSSGSIELLMPDKQGLDLNLKASKIKVNSLNNFCGTKEDDLIKGKINGGGIPVDIYTASGRVSINFK